MARRTIIASFVTCIDVDGRMRVPSPGDDVDLAPSEERRLEAAGAILPNRPMSLAASVNRPSVAAMVELAKLELGRGRRDRAQCVLDSELLAGALARPSVVDDVRRLLDGDGVLPRERGAVSSGEFAAMERESRGDLQWAAPSDVLLDSVGAHRS